MQMASRFNRFRSRKSNVPENDASSVRTFDEQGFLCPICYQKFKDHADLAQHYTTAHPQPSASKETKVEDSTDELTNLQQRFKASEETRLILINALQQEKQRVNDLEGDLEALQKQLRHAQTRLIEQSESAMPLKSNETDDGHALQKMKKLVEARDQLQSILIENQMTMDRFAQRFSSFENGSMQKSRTIEHDLNLITESIRLIQERKTTLKNSLTRSHRLITELREKNEQHRISNEKLMHDLQFEQKQNQSLRGQIEVYNSEIQQLEATIHIYKQETHRLMETKISSDQQSDLLRQLNDEKALLDQQNKDLRQQLKLNKQQYEGELNQLSRQINQLTSEKIRSEQEISTLRSQLNERTLQNGELIRQVNRLENDIESQKREFEQWKSSFTRQIEELEHEKYTYKQTLHQNERTINELKLQIKNSDIGRIQNDHLQSQLTQLKIQFHKKEAYIRHLSGTVHRCVKLAHRLHQHLQNTIGTSQNTVLALLEQIESEPKHSTDEILTEMSQSFHQIHTMISDRENHFHGEKILLRQQIREEYRQMIDVSEKRKEKMERLENVFHQVSESLSEANRNLREEREKCSALETELDSRTKRHEMQLSALKENLATVRTELKSANEKLSQIEQIKAEKADLEARLAVSQDERRALLERSLASENRNEKLSAENTQFSRKIIELDSALQEIAREYQVLQMQMTKLNQRRWLNDDDIHACMKCHQTFSITQRKHHCRSCGHIFCDGCSSKTAVVAASSKKPQRVCDQCYKDLTS